MDKFTKWGYFITYTEEILVEDIAQVYIKEVFLRHRVLDKIILDRDTRFILEIGRASCRERVCMLV